MPAAEPPPMSTRALLLSLALAAVVSAFFWHTLPIYPFRLLVTLMHESGHALMAKVVGGRVESLTISPTEGGLTQSLFEPTLLKRMLVSSAGYVGSSVVGAALLMFAGRMRSGRFLLWGLVAWMAVVAVVWVPFFPPATDDAAIVSHTGYARSDGLFTWAFILLIGAGLGLVGWKGPVGLRRAMIVWIATLSCLASLEDIKTLFGYGLGGSSSDADAMQRVTHLPAGFWAGLWFVLALFAMALGIRSIVKRRRGYAARARTSGALAL